MNINEINLEHNANTNSATSILSFDYDYNNDFEMQIFLSNFEIHSKTWTYLCNVSGSTKITAKAPAMHTSMFRIKGRAYGKVVR